MTLNGYELRERTFTIDGLGKNFNGYYNPRINWNGWLCPYFEEDVALQVCKALKRKLKKKDVVITDDGKTLYCVGGFELMWDLA